MKNILIGIFMFFLFSLAVLGADAKKTPAAAQKQPVSSSKIGTIDAKVNEAMDRIKNFKGKTVYETERFVDKNRQKAAALTEGSVVPKSVLMDTLAPMNITAGLLEGAAIGAGCGLIGYSQLRNLDVVPVVNGAVSGAITGGVLAIALSVVQSGSGNYYTSDSYGYGLVLGGLAGCGVGAAAGAIAGGNDKTTGGMGYGTAIGAFLGLVYGIIDAASAPADKSTRNKGHAFRMQAGPEYARLDLKTDF